MAKVFLVERPRGTIDLSTTEKYGEIVYIFDHNERRPSLFDVNQFMGAVLQKLKELEYKPEMDYICVTGGMIPVCLMIAALAYEGTEMNLLLYSATESKYIGRSL